MAVPARDLATHALHAGLFRYTCIMRGFSYFLDSELLVKHLGLAAGVDNALFFTRNPLRILGSPVWLPEGATAATANGTRTAQESRLRQPWHPVLTLLRCEHSCSGFV